MIRLSNLARKLAFTFAALTLLVSASQPVSGTASPAGPDTIPSAFFDPYSVAWASVRNMKSDQFSQYFSEKSREGYMVIDIEVDEIDGVQRVGAVWQRNIDERGWAEHRNLTDSQFHLLWEEYRDLGYRLIDQEAYYLGGALFYAGVWVENVEELGWASLRNLTSEDFTEQFERYRDLGYLPIDVEAYSGPDTLLYAIVWVENTENLSWVLWRNLTSAEFSDKFEEYRDDYRMIDVESYQAGSTQLYAGIWVENPSSRYWAEYRDMTAKGFGDRWLILRDAGYRLIDYEVYPTPTGWRYAGIWRQNSIRPAWTFKSQVDDLVEAYQDDNDVPGMSVAVYHQGSLVYLRGLGFADVDDGIIAHSRTIFRTASVAKAVAGALGMVLSEENLIDLTVPSSDYIPGLPVQHSHSVAQTLTNRSGVGHYDDHSSIVDEYDTALNAAMQLWSTPPVNIPGSAYLYSTHAYTYFGASVEGAVGDPLVSVFDQYLRDPFNLNTLRPEDRSVPHKFRATLYNTQNQEVLADDLSWKVLGGGLETSAYDLVRFGAYLVNGTMLDQDNLDLMWTRPDTLRNYGYGWDTGTQLGRTVVGKAGAQNGARSYIRIFPDDDLVVVVLSNRRDHDTRGLCMDIAEIILTGQQGLGPLSQDGLLANFPLLLDEPEEPEDEAQDPDEIEWPIENPIAVPTPEDLEEDDDMPVTEYVISLPLIVR
jgi:CubicO group peptidase (beta-lactamase class C family)